MEDVHEFMGWLHSQATAANEKLEGKEAHEKRIRENAVYREVNPVAEQMVRREVAVARARADTLAEVLTKASRCLV